MTAKEFTIWLRGYLDGISDTKPAGEIIDDVCKQLDLITEVEQPKINIDDIIKQLPKIPIQPFNPLQPYDDKNPLQQPYTVMYGCISTPFTFIQKTDDKTNIE